MSYTKDQRVLIVKTFYKCGESCIRTTRSLQRIWGRRKVPNETTRNHSETDKEVREIWIWISDGHEVYNSPTFCSVLGQTRCHQEERGVQSQDFSTSSLPRIGDVEEHLASSRKERSALASFQASSHTETGNPRLLYP